MSLVSTLAKQAREDPGLLVMLLFSFLSLSLSDSADAEVLKLLLFIILVEVVAGQTAGGSQAG